MTTFKELKEQPEFGKLHSQRSACFGCLRTLEENIESLPTDKLSHRSFTKIETACEVEITNLNAIDKKITQWSVSKGGVDRESDFVVYMKTSIQGHS